MSEKNYDRELGTLNAKVDMLKEQVEKYENGNQNKYDKIHLKLELEVKNIRNEISSTLKDINDKLDKKFEELTTQVGSINTERNYSKGFIKAALIVCSVLGTIITIAANYFIK